MTGGTVSGREIQDLPLQGRNALELALTVAGVSGQMGADESGVSYNVPSSGSGLIVGGGRNSSSAIMADGVSATSVGMGRATVTFSPDTIQEFKVVTSTFSAQYGVTGGGIISTVSSKSGTDEFHGNAFWFHRNPAVTARTFGQPFASTLRCHEFGLTLGGPVVVPKIYNGKHKTFSFVSYESKRRRSNSGGTTRRFSSFLRRSRPDSVTSVAADELKRWRLQSTGLNQSSNEYDTIAAIQCERSRPKQS